MINSDNVRVPLTMSKDRAAFLDAASKAYGISKSSLVNIALTEYFHSHMSDICEELRKAGFIDSL